MVSSRSCICTVFVSIWHWLLCLFVGEPQGIFAASHHTQHIITLTLDIQIHLCG